MTDAGWTNLAHGVIEWPNAMTATVNDADQMIAGLQEAAKIYREWEGQE
jgi:hypothetical protein